MALLDDIAKTGWNAVNFIGMSRNASENPWGVKLVKLGSDLGVQKAVSPARDAAWAQVTKATSSLDAKLKTLPGGRTISTGLNSAVTFLELDHPASAFAASLDIANPLQAAKVLKVLSKAQKVDKVVNVGKVPKLLDNILAARPKVGTKAGNVVSSLSKVSKQSDELAAIAARLKTKVSTQAADKTASMASIENKIKTAQSQIAKMSAQYQAKTLSRADWLNYKGLESSVSNLTKERGLLSRDLAKITNKLSPEVDNLVKVLSKQTTFVDDVIADTARFADDVSAYGKSVVNAGAAGIPKTLLTKLALGAGLTVGGGYALGKVIESMSNPVGKFYDSTMEGLQEQIDATNSTLSEILDYLNVNPDPEYPTEGEDAAALEQMLTALQEMLESTGKINGMDVSDLVGGSLSYEDLAGLYESGAITDETLAEYGIDPADFQSWSKLGQRSLYRWVIYIGATLGVGSIIYYLFFKPKDSDYLTAFKQIFSKTVDERVINNIPVRKRKEDGVIYW